MKSDEAKSCQQGGGSWTVSLGKCRGIVPQKQIIFGQLSESCLYIFSHRVLQIVNLSYGSILFENINYDYSFAIPKTKAKTFPADSCTRNFLGFGESGCLHPIDCCFISESYKYVQDSSIVTTRSLQFFKTSIYRTRCFYPFMLLVNFQTFGDPVWISFSNMRINENYMMGTFSTSDIRLTGICE